MDEDDVRPSVKHQAEPSPGHRGDRFVAVVEMTHGDEQPVERGPVTLCGQACGWIQD